MQEVNIAILGATGLVGTELLNLLHERNFPLANIYPLATKSSKKGFASFGNKNIKIHEAAEFDFSNVQLAIFNAGTEASKEFITEATAAKVVVIDNTALFRMEPGVPLVVPEVNSEQLINFDQHNIVAMPNSSTTQMAIALKPIYDAVGIKTIDVATYHAVSGQGNGAINSLVGEVVDLLNGKHLAKTVFNAQIAFNTVPQVGVFQPNGYTLEEMQMHWETKKLFADNDINVNATCVRVPVFYGHSMAITIETRNYISPLDVRAVLENADGVKVVDEPQAGLYPMPAVAMQDKDAVFVGRIRESQGRDNAISMWVVADNVRKGLALNAVQIAEILVKEYI